MDYYTVMVEVCKPREVVIYLQIYPLFLFGQIQSGPLKGVVIALCNLEEFLASMQYSPARAYADVIHQLHEGIEYFGNSASLVRSVYVNNMFAVELLGPVVNLS